MIWLWLWLVICAYFAIAGMLFYSISQEDEGRIYVDSILSRLLLSIFWLPVVLLLILMVVLVRASPSDKDLYGPKSK